MSGQRRFLGVDGGGTRTTAIVADEEGRVELAVVGESINYRSMGMERARRHLGEVVREANRRLGIDGYEAAFIGNSALGEEADPADLEALTAGVVVSDRLGMHSDAYIALMALTSGKPGILVISGTGSMAIGRNRDGELMTAGGWGHRLGDQGSAFDIAWKGIKASVAGIEGLADRTLLSEAAIRYFGVTDMKDLIPLFYAPSMERHILAGFASEVANVARRGDRVAADIMAGAVRDLVRHAAVLAEKLGIANVEIGASGGVFRHNAYVFESFKRELQARYPAAEVSLLALPPEAGAILECYRRCGIPATPAIRQQLSGSLNAAEVIYVNGKP